MMKHHIELVIWLIAINCSGYLYTKEFFLSGNLQEGASQALQGHIGVTGSVVRGFHKLNIPMNYNPRSIHEVGEHIFVLVNIDALHQAIELKKQRRIKTLIVGPNILNNPKEYNHILGSPEIDWYIAPCNWARDCNCEEEPFIKGKTVIWYAGVDTEFWKPQDSKEETKTMLIYWKTEPESFCIEIKTILQKHGWQTKCLRYGNYSQDQYKQLLNEVDAAIFISVSESQGIALAECWAMNVPTLVWNPGKVFVFNRWVNANSAPYLSKKTGFFWKNFEELEQLLKNFDVLNNEFNPRAWVQDYMTDEASILTLLDLINYILEAKTL
jgi:hypothetical protein